MQLTILGSGTCVPLLERSSPSNFLKIGKYNVLVDCGSGTLRQFQKAKIGYKDIDAVFITHFHTDHICDLGALIQALTWTPGYDRKKSLTLVGPVGFRKFYKNFLEPVSGKPRPNTYKIILKEIREKLVFGEFDVFCAKTVHSDTSIAYKFVHRGRSIVISGDCDFDEGLIKFSQNCDVLLLECSFPNEMKTEGHLTPKYCGLVAKNANVGKLILTHLYPTSPEIRLKQTQKIFQNTILAKDMMKVDI